MTNAVTDGIDATGSSLATLAVPAGYVVATYVTGSGVVPATAAELSKYPTAVRIAQAPVATTDENAHPDVLDVEANAATIADCAPWAKAELASFKAGTRPGQRSPAIYASESNITAVVNALVAGGVASGIGLYVANWTGSRADANAVLQTSGGPFPIIGVQYESQMADDLDLFLTSWLNDRSKVPTPPTPPDPPAPKPTPWHGVWVGCADGQTVTEGKLDVIELVSVDGGLTFTKVRPGTSSAAV